MIPALLLVTILSQRFFQETDISVVTSALLKTRLSSTTKLVEIQLNVFTPISPDINGTETFVIGLVILPLLISIGMTLVMEHVPIHSTP